MEVTRMRSHEGCANECLATYKSCLSAIDFCLDQGGKFAEPGHIRLLRVCAEICQTSAFVLMAHSTFHLRTCAICAEVCEACAESCEYLGGEKLLACAEMCRACADSCINMTIKDAA